MEAKIIFARLHYRYPRNQQGKWWHFAMSDKEFKNLGQLLAKAIPQAPGQDCPLPEVLAAFGEGALAPEEQERVYTHLVGCARGREICSEGGQATAFKEKLKSRPRLPGKTWQLLAASLVLVVALPWFWQSNWQQEPRQLESIKLGDKADFYGVFEVPPAQQKGGYSFLSSSAA